MTVGYDWGEREKDECEWGEREGVSRARERGDESGTGERKRRVRGARE